MGSCVCYWPLTTASSRARVPLSFRSADHLRLFREGQLVADHSRGLSDHTCRQLQHTTRLPMKPGHAKWGHRRSQMDDAPVAVQENHIDREPHGNRMDSLRGNNEQARTGFESWFAQ